MNLKAIIRNVAIIAAMCLITFALAEGIKQYNTLSIILEIGSLAALFATIYLHGLLRRLKDEEEQQAQ